MQIPKIDYGYIIGLILLIGLILSSVVSLILLVRSYDEQIELLKEQAELLKGQTELLKLLTYSQRYIAVQMLYEQSSKRQENLVISQYFLEEGDDGFRTMMSRENIEYVIQQFAKQRSLHGARANTLIRPEFLNSPELQLLSSQLPDDYYYLVKITGIDVLNALVDMIKLNREYFEKYRKNKCEHDSSKCNE